MNTIKKMAVIGAESTGKSTLCEQLARHFQTVCTVEFARAYLPSLENQYTEEDLLTIAKGQLELEREALSRANRFLFCDTDIMNIRVWSEVKFGRCSPELLALASNQEYDMYLLLLPDRPWEFDPLRENPDPEMRWQLTKYYQEYALGFHKPFYRLGAEQLLNETIQMLQHV